jgi:hypothetical protein
MNRDEALEVLNREVARLHGRTHAELVALIHAPWHSEHVTESGHKYQVEVGAAWDDKPDQVLRLFFSVDNGGIRAYVPLTMCGLVQPGSCFDGEVA